MEQKNKLQKRGSVSKIKNIQTESKNSKSSNIKKTVEISFESALQELDAILSKLEKGNLNLEETIKLYKQGAGLLEICNEKFSKASGTVTIIKNNIKEIFKDEIETC
ncbi:MAG: exodeoxyribonuclease VII small subunit [Clostridia bacterium]|nr:exodeoxyribonuclease VII small subunit [Clostridia bacterium]